MKPRTFEELVAYLTRYPNLKRHHPLKGITPIKFVGNRRQCGGHLFFDDGTHTPAGEPCGPGGFAPHLELHDYGFSIDLFGMTVLYCYMPSPTPAPGSSAAETRVLLCCHLVEHGWPARPANLTDAEAECRCIAKTTGLAEAEVVAIRENIRSRAVARNPSLSACVGHAGAAV